MPVLARRPVLALAVLLQAAGPSFALTADEVWAEAQRLSREANAEITATGRRQRDRLILTGVAIPLGPAGDRVLRNPSSALVDGQSVEFAAAAGTPASGAASAAK